MFHGKRIDYDSLTMTSFLSCKTILGLKKALRQVTQKRVG